ncbi:MAG: PKD domain-containing protein [Deltaproteobacteria bacterium]|nr:PKD domain-containing protein [Deltaproteobacteria bacterium]
MFSVLRFLGTLTALGIVGAAPAWARPPVIESVSFSIGGLPVSATQIPAHRGVLITCVAYEEDLVNPGATITRVRVAVSGGTLPNGTVTQDAPISPAGLVSGSLLWQTPAAGTHTVTCRAQDNGTFPVVGAKSVAVVVQTLGSPPAVEITSAGSAVLPGADLVLTSTVTDPEGGPFVFAWSTTGGNISAAGPAAVWTAPLAPGAYVVTLTVTDSTGLTGSAGVTVYSGHPPTVELFASANRVYPGEVVELTAQAADADGDPLAIEWSATSGQLSNSGLSASWVGTALGSSTLRVRVTDGSGLTATATVAVAVIWAEISSPMRAPELTRSFQPARLAADPAGFLYVSDPGSRQILVFNPRGDLLQRIPVQGVPVGVAVGAGAIYVGETDLGRVAIYDRLGDLLGTIGDQLVTPADLALDGMGRRLFVADSGTDSVEIFELSGQWVGAIDLPGQFVGALAISPSGDRVYVSDGAAGQVFVFDANSRAALGAVSSFGDHEDQLMRPAGLAVAATGHLYVTDSFQSAVSVFGPAGAFVGLLGQNGDDVGQLRIPTDAEVTSDGRLLVANSDGNRIETYALQGASSPSCPVDSDCDEVPDELELVFGLDPFDPRDGWADDDGDGLPNAVEASLGTDRLRTDSDGDEASDKEEWRAGTNPLDGSDHRPWVTASSVASVAPSLILLEGAGGDPNGEAVTFRWRQTGGPTVELAGADSAAASYVARLAGRYEFALTVSDGHLDATAFISTEVLNVAPTADAGPDLDAFAGDEVQLDGRFSSDANLDELSYSWTQLSGSPVTLSGASPRFTATAAGSYEFMLTVSAGGLEDVDTVRVLVDAPNDHVPVASIQTVGDEVGATVRLDGSSSSDVEATGLRYTWAQVEGPQVSLRGAAEQVASFIPAERGIYVFELVVSDGRHESTPRQATVAVGEAQNHPPLADAGADVRARVRVPVVLSSAASADPDGDPVTGSWRQLEGVAVVLVSTSSNATFVPLSAGTYEFELEVSDAEGLGTKDRVTVVVDDPGVDSVPIPGARFVQAGRRGGRLDASESYDAEGSPLSAAWTQVEGPRVRIRRGDRLTAMQDGTYVFALRVDDGSTRSPPLYLELMIPSGAQRTFLRRSTSKALTSSADASADASAEAMGCSNAGGRGSWLLVLFALPWALSRRRRVWFTSLFVLGLLWSHAAHATDPPHNPVKLANYCLDCHQLHRAPGLQLTKAAGNGNLCMSCHNPTGLAAPRPFASADQAYPGTAGTTHRWDSGVSGHVKAGGSNTSTGRIASKGTFTGRVEKTYTITITTAGNVGTARFTWTVSRGPGGGANVLSSTDVALNEGISVDFLNGSTSPSFQINDTWTIYVRTDLRLPDSGNPLERPLALRTSQDGGIYCSTCHDQHSQANAPPDPNAPAYGGAGTGWVSTGNGRHYQRVANDANQLCLVCHSARNVTTSAGGSHPIGVSIPASATFQTPPGLQLIGGQVHCTTCHSPHYATSGGANGGAGDGYLLDMSLGQVCYQCHTLADQANASHLSPTSGVLWPGGQYGSDFPAHSADKRGYCINCHWPHGWPDDANSSVDYTKLRVERYDVDATGKTDPDDAEDLCFTCHDSSPATSDVKLEIEQGTNGTDIFHHPVKDSQQTAGRVVECVSCHNPHKATATNRNAGVAGVNLAGAPTTDITSQYQLCFKCHGDTYNSSRAHTSNKRLDFAVSSPTFHPVTQAGRGQSANLGAQLLGGLTTSSTIRCTDCHNTSRVDTDAAPDQGVVDDSTSDTVGPHGSTYAPIIRANFSRSYTASGWNNNNARLCFRCHDQNTLFGSGTNFTDSANPGGSKGRGNLHAYHLTTKSVTASCMSCHYDIHSNQSASNTEYCVGTSIGNCSVSLGTSPPLGVKSHLVNFAPDVNALSYSEPRWHINTATGVRTCNLACHGKDMASITYKPSSGDETSHTYTVCVDGDGDTYYAASGCGTAVDCDDGNAAIYPGASESMQTECSDTQDNDCDSAIDCAESSCFVWCCHDSDADLYYAEAGCGTAVDCNDGNASINPGVAENTAGLCSDAADNDCDSNIDCSDSQCSGLGGCPSCTDGDGDLYYSTGGCGTAVDCNDANANINPGIAENTSGRCSDLVDNNCNGPIDCADGACAAFWTNADSDGYYAQSTAGACLGGDCLDSNSSVNPGAAENTCALCRDTLNNNCVSGTDLADPACAQQLEDTNTECSNGVDDDGDGKSNCHDRSCWSGAQCGGSSSTSCVSTAGGNNRNCCRPSGTRYACYRSECDGQPCDNGGTCDVY